MSITLSTATGSVLAEYAATSISIQRSMQPDSNGHLQPVFTGNLAYSRVDYLVDGSGNKTAIIQRTMVPPAPGAAPQPDPYQGWVNVSAAQLAGMDGAVPTVGLLTAIAAAADALIQADLVARGILMAPAAPVAS